ncbi:MAG: metallophosphoesterase [Thiomargarita sp.]|nr:metallophosphoesterase [Thiomargarita sp.]
MSDHLLIAQVTDIHIGAVDSLFKGVKIRENFLKVLDELKKKTLDLLVLSGDLAALNGEPEAYFWIKETLTHFPCPYIIMSGNHDHVGRMARIFENIENDVSDGMLYFSRTVKEKRLIFLDSSSTKVPVQQLDWLKNQLVNYEQDVVLFIHHPPLLCDCQFMDERYSLTNIESLWKVFNQLPQIKHIFCGHYHTEKVLAKNGKSIYLTPATIFQIDTVETNFKIAHTNPGWRIIEWGEDVNTYVEYLVDGKIDRKNYKLLGKNNTQHFLKFN